MGNRSLTDGQGLDPENFTRGQASCGMEIPGRRKKKGNTACRPFYTRRHPALQDPAPGRDGLIAMISELPLAIQGAQDKPQCVAILEPFMPVQRLKPYEPAAHKPAYPYQLIDDADAGRTGKYIHNRPSGS